jgi:hypothetical protein
MVVARAIENRLAADELRAACMSIALQLGGWVELGELQNASVLTSGRTQLVEESLVGVG